MFVAMTRVFLENEYISKGAWSPWEEFISWRNPRTTKHSSTCMEQEQDLQDVLVEPLVQAHKTH